MLLTGADLQEPGWTDGVGDNGLDLFNPKPCGGHLESGSRVAEVYAELMTSVIDGSANRATLSHAVVEFTSDGDAQQYVERLRGRVSECVHSNRRQVGAEEYRTVPIGSPAGPESLAYRLEVVGRSTVNEDVAVLRRGHVVVVLDLVAQEGARKVVTVERIAAYLRLAQEKLMSGGF